MAVAQTIITAGHRYPYAYETHIDLDEPCEQCGATEWLALDCYSEAENPWSSDSDGPRLDVCRVRCGRCEHETTLREGV